MILYHGTVSNFNEVKIIKTTGDRDFGIGFYTTDELEHAKSRAHKLYLNGLKDNRHYTKYVYSFNINKSELRAILNVKEFNKMTTEWLDTVVAFRNGYIPIGSDVIIGPTADAAMRKIINDECLSRFDSISGKLLMSTQDKKIVMRRLKLDTYGTQYCFRTLRAVKWLNNHFLERREFYNE